jgi:hypothetical protein
MKPANSKVTMLRSILDLGEVRTRELMGLARLFDQRRLPAGTVLA